MSSDNDENAASNPAKCQRPASRVSDVGGRPPENVDPPRGTDDESLASLSAGEFHVMTRAVDITSLSIYFTYDHPPSESNALKALKGTKLEPLCALLVTLPEQFTTTIVAQSQTTLDLTQKIKM